LPKLSDIFVDFILPALIVAAALAIAWRPKRNGRWIGALAVSAGFAIAYSGIGGSPHWPPGSGDASYWLIWFTVPTAVFGLFDAIVKPPSWAGALVLWILILPAIKAMAAPLGPHGASAAEIAIWTAMAVIWWLAWESLAARQPGPLAPTLLALALAASAAVMGVSNNIKPSQGAVALTGMAIAALILSCLIRGIYLDRSAMLGWIIPLLGLFLFVHLYSYTEPPTASVVLILLAPILALAADLPGLRRGRWAMILVPVILALAAAVGLSARQYLQSPAAAAPQGQQPGDY
jgi:hypothetical protein